MSAASATLTTRRLGFIGRVASAFLHVSFARALSYPMNFVMSDLAALIPMFVYFFVARLVDSTAPAVGGDYFTFVVIGIAAHHALGAGLQGFSHELDRAVKDGRFETLLVEPIPWRALPFGFAEFPFIIRGSASVLVAAIAAGLGANYVAGGFPVALGLLLLGMVATLAIGIVAGSVRILSKESDPVLTLYTLVTSVLSGVFFPLSVLPGFLRIVSYALPHTYVIQALRKVLMPGGGDLPGLSVGGSLVALVVFNAVVMPVALWLFGRSLDFGRRIGVLGGY